MAETNKSIEYGVFLLWFESSTVIQRLRSHYFCGILAFGLLDQVLNDNCFHCNAKWWTNVLSIARYRSKHYAQNQEHTIIGPLRAIREWFQNDIFWKLFCNFWTVSGFFKKAHTLIAELFSRREIEIEHPSLLGPPRVCKILWRVTKAK